MIREQIAKLMGIALAVSFFSGCSQSTETAEESTRPVRTEIVKLTQSNFELDLSGEVQARYVNNLSFQVTGKLTERLVDVGQSVKKNQLLAKIDDRDYRLQLEQAKAKFNVTNANYQRAESELERFEQLLQQKLISPSQHETQLNLTRVAKAQQQEAQSAVNIAKNRMQYTELHASAAGVVTQITAEVGMVLPAGQAFIEVAQPTQKEIAVEIPESLLSGVKPNDKVSISIWALPKQMFSGHIREISPKADNLTRTYLAKVAVDTGSELMELGMSARIRFEKNTGQAVAHIPPTAIVIYDSQPHVWVVDMNTMLVERRPVQVAEQLTKKIIVFSGLNAGDVVVTAGVHRLFEGQAVRLLAE